MTNNHINGWGYDALGNVNQIASMARSFIYDAESRQVSATINGQSTSYIYDGDGRRVQKIAPNGTTTYVYDAGGQLAAEYSTVAQTANGTRYLTGHFVGFGELQGTFE
ncbi:MAG: hypothetical protein LAP38_09360 [Acidobacteriia bacterium]|nr:hypothetical protein [Terriglobia bacterium]